MALHASKLAFQQIHLFLQQQITRADMETTYSKNWQLQFAKRVRTGRIIQRLFGKSVVTNVFVQLVKTLPFLAKPLIRLTHGRTY